ncbi:MAG: hypothetical protein IPJ90_02505 [Anaerolineaceae bacterium]|nr:hypothetical protein [Anaerolineaceae bacterium]
MIASLSGTILKIEDSSLVIGVGGVGIRLLHRAGLEHRRGRNQALQNIPGL